MAVDNTVTITGNATRDPELRFTNNGQPVAGVGVAVNRRWQDRTTNEWKEETSFFDVTSWGSLAENVAESVQKGTRVTVTGRLQQRNWETDEGDPRSKVDITADSVAIDLRWATAVVTKNQKSNGSSDPLAGVASSSSPADVYNPDEEPF